MSALLERDVYPDYAPEQIEAETSFYTITTDNEVIFPRWDKLEFSGFWWQYFQDKARREILCIGRGGGKTWNIAFKKVVRAFAAYAVVKESGIRYTGAQWHLMIICPSEENYKPLCEMLEEMIPKVPGYAPDGHLNYRMRTGKKTDWRLFGRNELLITVLSSYNSDYLRGKYADDLWIDEAAEVKSDDIESVLIQVIQRQGRPPNSGFMTASSTPDTEKIKDPWFDSACDQADPNRPDRKGFFDNFKLYEGSWLVNARISEQLYDDILREPKLNAQKFQRQRMGKRGLVIGMHSNADGTIGNFISMGMLQPCFYRDAAVSPIQTVIAIDLAFGTRDSLARMFFDKASHSVYALDIWDAKDTKELVIKEKDPIAGIVDFIVETARQYPSARIIYDANGEYASSVERLLPKWIRAKGVKKNGASKNKLCDTLEKVLTRVDGAGKNTALLIPHWDASFLSSQQSKNFRRLTTEAVNYRREIEFDKRDNAKKIVYTKVAPFSDDALDTLLLLMDEMEPARTAGRKSLSAARQRAA